MKASELRIGNILNLNQELVTASQIQYDGFIGVFRLSPVEEWEWVGYWPESKLEAVPITTSVLLKFGFEKIRKNHFQVNGNNIEIEIVNSEMSSLTFCRIRHHEFGLILIKTVEYVHELQNLYFSLSGEELKYNSSITK